MAAPASDQPDELIVEFDDDVRTVAPGDELTFGRSADLSVDTNQYLHRVLGRFHHEADIWWLANVGSAIPVRVDDATGPSYSIVAPGARSPITFAETTVSFEAGRAAYELVVRRPALLARAGAADGAATGSGDPGDTLDPEATTLAADVPLNEEQRLLLAALCEPFLRGGSGAELGTNRQVAHRLGWTITKYNRKLDWICQKFSSAGVPGLVGSEDLLARDRRQRLVEHVLHTGTIGADDVDRLPDVG